MITTRTRFHTAIPALILTLIFSVSFFGCTECDECGAVLPNRMPETRLSNVPPPGTISTSPLVTLSWLGDDADGYVVAYRYRWSFRLSPADPFEYKPYTYILNIMSGGLAMIIEGDETDAPKVYKFFSTLPPEGLDTTRLNALARGDTIEIEGVRLYASNPDDERYPTHESPSKGTFIFDSQDILNPHTFEVSAIDNLGAVDSTPATVDFSTPKVPPPNSIVAVGPTDTVLVLNEFTDTFEGIYFEFQGFDPNSRTIEYSWVIDKDQWGSAPVPWSEFSLNPGVRVKASDFPDPYAVNHTIYVRARNEFGSIDTLGYFTRPVNVGTDSARLDTFYARRNFQTIYPSFAIPGTPQRILIINNSFDWDTLAVLPHKPAWSTLIQYYRDLYDGLGLAGKYDIINVGATPDFPGRGVLGQYSLVHFVGDITNDFNRYASFSSGNQQKIKDYCYVGGKFLMNGWNTTRADNLPPSTEFWNYILHILNQQPAIGPEYVGSVHQTIPDAVQYPDAPLDQAKLDTAWHGAMPAFYVYQAYGFGEIIYRYDSKSNIFFLEGVPLGIRYIGLTYDVIFLGFPLYYTEQPAAMEILRKALQDLNHL